MTDVAGAGAGLDSSGESAAALDRLGLALRSTKADLVDRFDGDRLDQPGGAVLAEPFPVRVPRPDDPVWPVERDPVLETFVVGPDGAAMATGGDSAVASWWQPQVDALVARVVQVAAAGRIRLEWPAFVTTSTTPVEVVASMPHVDDDQIVAGEGVGLVAIVASHAGPRLATAPIRCQLPRPPAPLEVLDDDLGSAPRSFPADRVVLLARFGQLHSGPTASEIDHEIGPVRNLLVLRVGTVPSPAG